MKDPFHRFHGQITERLAGGLNAMTAQQEIEAGRELEREVGRRGVVELGYMSA